MRRQRGLRTSFWSPACATRAKYNQTINQFQCFSAIQLNTHQTNLQDLNAATARAAYQFLESSLRNKSEVVVYEAARAICNLPGVEMNDLSPAITVLQLFLSRYFDGACVCICVCGLMMCQLVPLVLSNI